MKQETKGDKQQSRGESPCSGTVKKTFLKDVRVAMGLEERVDRCRLSEEDSEGLREALKEKLNEEVEMLGAYLGKHMWPSSFTGHTFPEPSTRTKTSPRHSLRPKGPEI